jgi:hypothetical protein
LALAQRHPPPQLHGLLHSQRSPHEQRSGVASEQQQALFSHRQLSFLLRFTVITP